jgi:hypothetical protein
LTAQQRQELDVVLRVLRGESPEDVARQLGLSLGVVNRAADDLIRPDWLKPCLENMAAEFGFVGKMEFPFPLGVGTKAYTPDCVWFADEPRPEAVVAIFEIEVDTSPKHRAGGMAFANFVGLSRSSRVRFFAITLLKHKTVMENTLQLFSKSLAEKWCLDAVVVPSFSPAVIREKVRAAFSA